MTMHEVYFDEKIKYFSRGLRITIYSSWKNFYFLNPEFLIIANIFVEKNPIQKVHFDVKIMGS